MRKRREKIILRIYIFMKAVLKNYMTDLVQRAEI